MGLTVNIVQFGNETQVEVDEGANYAAVLQKIPNGKNLDVREGGKPVKASDKVRDGARLTAAPRQVKQGS